MRNTTKKLVGTAGRLLLVSLLVLSQSVWAGQDPKAKDNPKPLQTVATQQMGEKSSATSASKALTEEAQGEESQRATSNEKSTREGKHEGIKVHGHWTIEVKNPDGTVVTHREFENSLVATSGPSLLATILQCFTVGNCPNRANSIVWDVQLIGNPQPCTGQVPDPNNPGGYITGPAPCFLDGPASGYPLSTAIQGTSFVLTGSTTATQNGAINRVSTDLPGSLPFAGNFTSATLTTPIQVSAGQTVAVTVNISFS